MLHQLKKILTPIILHPQKRWSTTAEAKLRSLQEELSAKINEFHDENRDIGFMCFIPEQQKTAREELGSLLKEIEGLKKEIATLKERKLTPPTK